MSIIGCSLGLFLSLHIEIRSSIGQLESLLTMILDTDNINTPLDLLIKILDWRCLLDLIPVLLGHLCCINILSPFMMGIGLRNLSVWIDTVFLNSILNLSIIPMSSVFVVISMFGVDN